MRGMLLGSVAAVALASIAATAWADDRNANNNAGTAISQLGDGDSDAIASGGNAVDDGAYTGSGNALGDDADHNAAADRNSTALQITAGNGVADIGSALNVGDRNEGASSSDGSAAATGSSTAISTFNFIFDGSAHVIGDHNRTAAAEEGGAAVVGNGTAVGINDIDINAEDATAGFGQGNVVAAAHLEEVTTFSTDLSIAGGEIGLGISGFFFKAEAELAGAIAYGPTATIATGNINNNSLGSLTGANMFAGNTGLANQGDSIGIAANNAF